jgi:hypothetical protein
MSGEDIENEVIETEDGQDGTLLASLAILSVNATTENQAYLDHFVPFVVEALASECKGSGTHSEIAKVLTNQFGLVIPTLVVHDILKRAERKSLVSNRDSVFTLKEGADRGRSSFLTLRNNALREQAALANQLVAFVKTKFELDWNIEEAENALQQFVGQMSVPFMRSVLSGNATVTKSARPEATEASMSYIVGEFLTTVLLQDPTNFAYLESMVKGSMLTSALFFPGTAEPTRKFKKTTIWIDTSLVIQWLGLEGEEPASYISMVLDLATQQGAALGVFSHTLQEVRGIVHSAIDGSQFADGQRPGGVALYFRSERKTFAEVNSIARSLEEKITSKGAIIADVPDYEPRYCVDEVALDKVMDDIVHYQRPEARKRDLKSLTAVHRLRRDFYSDCIEESRALLLTDNHSLVVASTSFFGKNRLKWPVAALDHEVASLLWSKRPMDAPDLPRNRMIADALAALQPSPALWSAYDREIERLAARKPENADDVTFLRHSTEAKRFLMEETLGGTKQVTSDVIDSIYKGIIETNVAPVRAKLDETESKLDQTASKLGVTESKLDETESERDAKSKENKALVKRLADLEARDNRVMKEVLNKSEKYSDILCRVLKTASLGLYACFAWASIHLFVPTFPYPQSPAGTYLGFIALLFTLLHGAFAVYERSFFTLADTCKQVLQQRLQKRSFRKLGFDQQSANLTE